MTEIVAGLAGAGGIPVGLPVGDVARLETLGEGLPRWVADAVERGLLALEADIHDALAPRAAIRSFSARLLVAALLDLTGAERAPARVIDVDEDIVRDAVGRGIATTEMTQAMRTVQQVWLGMLLEAATSARPNEPALVADIAASMCRTMDSWVAVMAEAIDAERHREAATKQMRVRSVVQKLLAGNPVAAQTARRALGVRLTLWHTCWVLGVPHGGRAERPVLDSLVQAVTRAAGAGRLLQYETSAGELCLWAATERPFAPTIDARIHVPGALVVGVGGSHPGAEGFRRSYLEADDAFQCASRGAAGRLISYPEDSLAILLCRDEERARWFVEGELGELAADRPDMAEMRATIRALFEARMRIATAAESLHLHRNTLIHRLERIEAVLGHGIAERSAHTQAALLVLDLLQRRGQGERVG